MKINTIKYMKQLSFERIPKRTKYVWTFLVPREAIFKYQMQGCLYSPLKYFFFAKKKNVKFVVIKWQLSIGSKNVHMPKCFKLCTRYCGYVFPALKNFSKRKSINTPLFNGKLHIQNVQIKWDIFWVFMQKTLF